MPTYCVYILASKSRALYVGVTNDLARRLGEHHAGLGGYTSRYGINRLVYYETTFDVTAAITREKELKTWRRAKKLTLINTANPRWQDLSEEW